jgi:hypothetical protein
MSENCRPIKWRYLYIKIDPIADSEALLTLISITLNVRIQATVYCVIGALFEENETLGNAMKSVCLWQEILCSLLIVPSS